MERLHSKPTRIIAVAAAAGSLAALGIGAYKWKAHQDTAPRCSQIMFAVPKGAPGSININVYPVIEGALRPISNVHGTITDGLNADKTIEPSSDNTHGVITQYKWDVANTNIQWSRLLVSGEVDGRTFQCREQIMTLLPDMPAVGPRVPKYPPF